MEKERLYLQREACYWSQRSTEQPMTYYALSTFKQTLSNSASKAFCRLKSAFSYISLQILISKQKHLLSISTNRRTQLPRHTLWSVGAQGASDMPKTIFAKFVLVWFEGICLAFQLCRGFKKKKKSEELHPRKPISFSMFWENAANRFHRSFC